MVGTFRIPQALGVVALLLAVPGRHPTPSVTLARQADVVRQGLPGAQQFFVRNVTVGRDDLAKIRQVVDFTPEDPDVKFYYAQDGAGKFIGVVLFPQVNTMHGPIEVGIAIGPSGTVTSAVVTKASVETKPWVLRVVTAGLMRRFNGLRPGDDVDQALQGMSAGSVGNMPYYFATVIAATVKRGLVLYQTLFHS